MQSAQSARGLAHSKTRRVTGARNSSRFNVQGSQTIGSVRCAPPFLARSGLKSALLALLLLSTSILQFSTTLHAQSFSIDWHTLDGGGGSSTGGVFRVSGTIGQPDAGAMSGGNFSLTGGFWALPIAVQTTNAPTLSITNAASGFATITWSPPTPGLRLQESPTLDPPAWTNAPSGTNQPVTVPLNWPVKFYRLHSQ